MGYYHNDFTTFGFLSSIKKSGFVNGANFAKKFNNEMTGEA